MAILILSILIIAVLTIRQLQQPSHVIAPTGTFDGDILMTRYIRRAKTFRDVGGIIGLGLLVTRLALETEPGMTLRLNEVMAWGLSGSLVATLAAELHRIRRPSIVMGADLAVRSPALFVDAKGSHRIVVLLAASAVGATVARWYEMDRIYVYPITIGVLSFARKFAVRRIAQRGRPTLPIALEQVDNRIRRIAIANGGIGHEQ